MRHSADKMDKRRNSFGSRNPRRKRGRDCEHGSCLVSTEKNFGSESYKPIPNGKSHDVNISSAGHISAIFETSCQKADVIIEKEVCCFDLGLVSGPCL